MSTTTVPPAFRAVGRAWRRPIAGQVEVGDALLATAASAAVVALVTGMLPSPGPHGGAIAALAALLMTAPVLLRHRAPVAVCVAVAAGALINVTAIGGMVRCGAALPVLLIAAFTLGYSRNRLLVVAGTAALGVSAVAQAVSDPALDPGVLVVLIPALACCGFAGLLLTGRRRAAAELLARNRELHAQREATARLAVAADRARISADLDVTLNRQLEEIARTASAADPAERDAADAALARIETTGRSALAHMRDVVGALRPAERGPAPSLSQLDALLERATDADVRLAIEGTPVDLPPGVELSAYRIVELLLVALEDSAAARIDVTVLFTAHVLGIMVSGSAAGAASWTAAVAAARQRAEVHGGHVEERTAGSRCQLSARLPVVSAGA